VPAGRDALQHLPDRCSTSISARCLSALSTGSDPNALETWQIVLWIKDQVRNGQLQMQSVLTVDIVRSIGSHPTVQDAEFLRMSPSLRSAVSNAAGERPSIK
jgi:hypothetical protein